MTFLRRWRFALVVLACLPLLGLPVAAQHAGKDHAALPAALARQLQTLRQAALSSDYAYRQVAYLSNNIGPRLSGSPQAQQAVTHVAEELRRLGLDVKLEKVMVPHWVRGIESGELVEYPARVPGATQKLVLTALGGSVPTPPDGITAEVVVVHNFDELQGLPVRGKVVLYDVPFDKRLAAMGYGLDAYGQAVVYRGSGAVQAARQGAVASLVRSVGGAEFRLAHTGAMHYDPQVPKIPAAAIAAEDADLIAYLAGQGRVRLHLCLTPQTLPPVESYNVVADLKGATYPQQVVIVSGHLDSWDLGTGALDDAAGVGAAMQAVHLPLLLHLRPARTIRMIAWMNEENGLAGAKAYQAAHLNELSNHVAAIECDLGCGHPAGFSGHAAAAKLHDLEPVADLLGGVLHSSDEAGGADLTYLDQCGVPTFGPLQDSRTYFNYHHTAADTLDKVVPQDLAENAAVMTVLAYALANLP